MNPPNHRLCTSVALFLTLAVPAAIFADDAATKTDPRYPFRTDFANANLPWYQPKPGEFPPHHSDHRVSGQLVSADFIHRTGQFRTTQTGELIDFTMPPYGAVNYLNTEADLRDVPLGTYFLFFLNQDAHGNFTRLATMRDQFTMDAGHSFSYRLDELKLADGKLLTTKQSLPKKQPDLGKRELVITDQTRFWKADKQAKPTDLAVGDELLFNLTGKTAANPGRCTDIWIGADAQKRATEQQRANFTAFINRRGLPGWIDKVDGKQLTVTLFSGDPANFKRTWLPEFTLGKEVRAVVANDELRTWNPPVDAERSTLNDLQNVPVDAYGTSGVRIVFTVGNMLEGFRKGRVIRVFTATGKLKDQFYGESLMGYGYGALKDPELLELPPKEYPTQFPFRTDYGNEHLPWFQISMGETPPRFSEHLVLGELLKADPAQHTGQFRTDRTGEVVTFTLVPGSSVQYLNADAELSDIPPGTRCRFHMYQDDKGAFTRAAFVSDEFSHLAQTAVTYRVEAVNAAEGKLHVARQIPEVKNYNGDMEQPPDIGRTELLTTADTRIRKADQPLKLTDLAVGDLLLVNLTSDQPGSPSRCTDIWIGPDTFKAATEAQRKKHPAKK